MEEIIHWLPNLYKKILTQSQFVQLYIKDQFANWSDFGLRKGEAL